MTWLDIITPKKEDQEKADAIFKILTVPKPPK
jgi:hypothetical protein